MLAWRKTAIALLLVGASSATAMANDINGQARILDGDTIAVGASKIRLEGIDAPETDQLCLRADGTKWACGIAAKEQLQILADRGPWKCHVSGTDKYRRSLANCLVGTEDVSRTMVKAGWALAFVRYSRTYEAEEKIAREQQAGLWSGAFVAPWDWRSRNNSTVILGALSVPRDAQSTLLSSVAASEAPSPDCVIKANTRRSGECIYHRPGNNAYAKIKMTIAKGKRWFCSTEEAEAAGCRAAMR